ncbi:MAG: ChaN family lipoprotein [Rhodobacteraceae bacterium]|nr:ChaN family lipoprotein [Paracoccaceae bacterium]
MIKTIIAFACLAAPALAQPDLLNNLPEADVVFLGEVHDNPAHHENQTIATQAIGPAALVFEMLTDDQAARIPADAVLDQDALQAALDWDRSGWPDFAMYYPLFTAAPTATIFGAGLPRDAARNAMGQPLTQAFSGDAARFGLDMPLDSVQQQAREDLQARAHCNALPDEMLPMMVDIQRLRDAMLADAALKAYQDTGGPVVVITGTGHARTDWGAPALLAQAAPDLRVLSIGQFESEPDDPAHDLHLVTEPHPRPDPCDAFR